LVWGTGQRNWRIHGRFDVLLETETTTLLSVKRIALHIALWAALFLFWFFISRDHHPTLLIDGLATGVLVAVTAACVYINRLVLRPRRAAHGRPWQYAGELPAVILAADLIAVLVIQWIYDTLWGPDPLRYGFLTNVLYEAGFIGLHMLVVWVVGRAIGRQPLMHRDIQG
jgi:hypothetical protein